MAGKTVNFNSQSTLVSQSQLESLAKWLSCNDEVWGVGPTIVFASAAALFLYHELEATIFVAGDHGQISNLEKTLVSTMVLGMLALMIHVWVCAMRFFQYYLDTLIRDSPNMLLEMTTAGLLGTQGELAALGPLTRFLRQQQPQIHITICWFLSLCYADYVRKHYCQRFNMPYLEQWQSEMHSRASRGVTHTMQKVNSFVGAFHQRLRGYAPLTSPSRDLIDTVRARHPKPTTSGRARSSGGARGAGEGHSPTRASRTAAASSAYGSSDSRARPPRTRLRNSVLLYQQHDARAAFRRWPASAAAPPPLKPRNESDTHLEHRYYPPHRRIGSHLLK